MGILLKVSRRVIYFLSNKCIHFSPFPLDTRWYWWLRLLRDCNATALHWSESPPRNLPRLRSICGVQNTVTVGAVCWSRTVAAFCIVCSSGGGWPVLVAAARLLGFHESSRSAAGHQLQLQQTQHTARRGEVWSSNLHFYRHTLQPTFTSLVTLRNRFFCPHDHNVFLSS